MTKLYICLKNDRIKTVIEQICKDIFVIDKTFNFTIFKNRRFMGREQDCQFILSINCKDKDEAHKKGCWFVNKAGVKEDVDENVIRKIEGLYYWVK